MKICLIEGKFVTLQFEKELKPIINKLILENMKKLVLLFAAFTFAASVSAQTVTESKIFDNVYVGVNGGVATKMTGQNGWLGGLNSNAGLRIGRYFTPVFGLAVESNVYFANKPFGTSKTVARFLNTSLLGTVNLSNWFYGYKGQPRFFEVVALGGFGWGHTFGTPYTDINVGTAVIETPTIGSTVEDAQGQEIFYATKNNLTSKVALDFNFNFGGKKQFQFYLEPAVIWGLNDETANYADAETTEATGRTDIWGGDLGHSGVEYNIHKAFFQVNAGLVYKFKNSNGTHNFTIAQLRDQAEIDDLNAQINALRNRKPEVITKEVIKEVAQPVKEISVNDLVFVTFAQGKSVLTKEAKAALDEVKEGKHVQIVGTASPEGPAALNQKLSEARANVTAEYLKGRGVIVDEATGKGVQGVTSNRLAVVYVK